MILILLPVTLVQKAPSLTSAERQTTPCHYSMRTSKTPLILLAYLSCFLLLLAPDTLIGQTVFRPGYVVKNSKDTIFAQLGYRGDLQMGRSCQVKKDGNITVYAPDEIEGYAFSDGRVFVAAEVDGTNVFLERLAKGVISLFYLRDENADRYFLDKEDLRLTELVYDKEIRKVDGKSLEFESSTHIARLNYFMENSPWAQKNTDQLGKPQHDNLLKLIEGYHKRIGREDELIIYEKKKKVSKVNLELLGASRNYFNVPDLQDQWYTETGLIAHIWMPRTSEKLFFRTGVSYSRLALENGTDSHFSVPVQLEYIYPKGFIRPRVAYGPVFHAIASNTVAVNAGLNARVYNNFFLSLAVDTGFNQLLVFLPESYLSTSIQLGVLWMPSNR